MVVMTPQPGKLFKKCWICPVCAPPPLSTPATKHVPLHSKSLCKNWAHASGGGAYNMHQLSKGGTNGKNPKKLLTTTQKTHKKQRCQGIYKIVSYIFFLIFLWSHLLEFLIIREAKYFGALFKKNTRSSYN